VRVQDARAAANAAASVLLRVFCCCRCATLAVDIVQRVLPNAAACARDVFLFMLLLSPSAFARGWAVKCVQVAAVVMVMGVAAVVELPDSLTAPLHKKPPSSTCGFDDRGARRPPDARDAWVCLSVSQSVSLSVCLAVCLSVCMYVLLAVWRLGFGGTRGPGGEICWPAGNDPAQAPCLHGLQLGWRLRLGWRQERERQERAGAAFVLTLGGRRRAGVP
jgi:hypothetical protein